MTRLTFIFLLFCSCSFGQTNNYQKLLDTAFRFHGSLIVHSKPLIVTRLNEKEMWYYYENVKGYSNQELDTLMFSQIIDNAKTVDSTIWTDNELPFNLLVDQRSENVSKEYVIQKFKLNNRNQIRNLAKYVNKFNSTKISDRVICYYSRPVFDNSKTFAIVQWDNGHSYLGGGGGIILYRLQSDKTWKEFGTILNWRY
jgi:hypothetical protein